MQSPALPPPEEIALLEPFERLGLERIALVGTAKEAERAADLLVRAAVCGAAPERGRR